MAIRVECYAGYRGEQEPRAFWLGDRRLEAAEILDRWLAPDQRYFKVKAEDGNAYILRYDEARDEWELGGFTRAQAATPAAGGASGVHATRSDDA